MKKFTAHKRSATGFTILELLMVVIIIGILVAIIIPVLSNRAEDARKSAALQDLDAIRSAQEHSSIDTGYFYRLFVLDDTRFGDNVPSDVQATNGRDRIDGVRDEQLRNDTSPNQTSLFVDIRSGDVLTNGPSIYSRLSTNETAFNWNGPYLNLQKKSPSPADLPALPNGLKHPSAGMPLDPWGSAYMLFTVGGLVKEPEGTVVQNVTASDLKQYPANVFDRPTVLSLGPNGLPGDGSGNYNNGLGGFGQGDDLYRQF